MHFSLLVIIIVWTLNISEFLYLLLEIVCLPVHNEHFAHRLWPMIYFSVIFFSFSPPTLSHAQSEIHMNLSMPFSYLLTLILMHKSLPCTLHYTSMNEVVAIVSRRKIQMYLNFSQYYVCENFYFRLPYFYFIYTNLEMVPSKQIMSWRSQFKHTYVHNSWRNQFKN